MRKRFSPKKVFSATTVILGFILVIQTPTLQSIIQTYLQYSSTKIQNVEDFASKGTTENGPILSEYTSRHNIQNSELTSGNQVLQHFGEAKHAARILFHDHRRTFYCGCKFDKHQKVDLKSCGYQIQEDVRRARRLEWEHIVPVSHLASNLPCWKKKLCCNEEGKCYKGRECCRKIDPQFARMEADLHNLVPEIGELNGLRSNFHFDLLPNAPEGQFGGCEIKIDRNNHRVEPPVVLRGWIARAYLYMASHYPLQLSDSQLQLFREWNKNYPPDEWEMEWNRRIIQVQGNSNPYISNYREYINPTRQASVFATKAKDSAWKTQAISGQ